MLYFVFYYFNNNIIIFNMDNNANKEVVINQTKINEVINSIAAASAVIKNTSSNLLKLVQDKNIEAIVKAEKNFKRLAPMMTSYTQIMSSVISSITKDMPEGKSLNEALGRLEEKDKQSGKVTVTYTVIDAVKEVQKFIDSTVDSVKKISESDFGFKTMNKVRRNINVMKTMITGIMQELISSFAEIANGPAVKDIIKVMVKQPDSEMIEFSDKSAIDDKTELKDIIQNTYKESGQLGLVDVFTQTFNLLGAVAAMDPPNFITLQLKIIKLTRALKLTFNTLISFLTEYATEDVLEVIKTMSEVIGGKSSSDNNNDGHDGLMKLTNKLNFLLENLLKLNYNSKTSKKVDESILNIKKTIENILSLIQDKNINEVIANSSFSNKLTKFSSNIETIREIFTSVRTIALESIVITIFGKFIVSAINVVVNFITALDKLKDKEIDDNIVNTLDKLKDVIDSFKKLTLSIIVLGLASIVAATALIPIFIFIYLLSLFLTGLSFAFKLIDKASAKINDSVKNIRNIFVGLMFIGVAILLFAVATPIITKALTGYVLPFIFILGLSIFLLWFLSWVINKITVRARKEVMDIAINMLVITGVLLVIAAFVLILAGIGLLIDEMDAGLHACILLLVVGIILLGIIGLIKIIERANLRKAIDDILPLFLVVALLASIGLLILFFAFIGKQLSDPITQEYIIGGIAGITVTIFGIIGLAKIISSIKGDLTKAMATVTLLLAVLGLLVAVGISILIFAFIGKQLQEDGTFMAVITALGYIIGLTAILVGLAWGLSFAAPYLTLTIAVVPVLLITLGVLIGSALLVLALAAIGKKYEEIEAGTYVGKAIGTMALIAAELGLLGLEMLIAGPLCLVLTAALVPMVIALALMIPLAKTIESLTDIGIRLFEKESISKTSYVIGVVATVGAELGLLGLELAVLAAGCVAVSLFIGPILSAISSISAAAEKLEKLSESKIDLSTISENITSVKSFFGTYKTMINSFSLADILFINNKAERVSGTIKYMVKSVYNIATTLNEIKTVSIDTTGILDTVGKVFGFIEQLNTKIDTILTDDEKGGNFVSRWFARRKEKDKHKAAIDKMNRVEQMVLKVQTIADTISSIKKFKLSDEDKTTIVGTVQNIFEFIDSLNAEINELLTPKEDELLLQILAAAEEKSVDTLRVEKLNSVDQVVSSIKNITDSLQSIQRITLNTSKIQANIKFIFETIDDIAEKLRATLMDPNIGKKIDELFAQEVKYYIKHNGGLFKKDWYEPVYGDSKAVEALNNVDKVVSVLGNVIGTIKGLSEIKLTPDVKATINKNIESVFKFMDNIAVKISDLLNPTKTAIARLPEMSDMDYQAALALADEEYNKKVKVKDALTGDSLKTFGEHSDSISKVVGTLSTVTETISKIKDFKLKDGDIGRIHDNITILFNAVDFIVVGVETKMKEVKDISNIAGELDILTTGLENMNASFENIGSTDTKAFKTNLTNFGEFIGTVNKVNVEKVEKTTKLFEKMSELTANMKGDFNKVAETLTEKLIPVLEDLKTIMVDVPEKLDKGFSNTSASIAAANQPPTTRGYMAQVKREEPNISEKEAERKAVERMNEKAQADSNGIAAKLDELIALFKGMGGDTAVVRTV